MIRKILSFLKLFGFNPRATFYSIKSLPWFVKEFRELKKQLGNSKEFPIRLNPIFEEKFLDGGTMSGHYFHQDLLVAQKIFKANPIKHIDIGSRTDGFVAHVATYRFIEVFDIRAIVSKVENIKFVEADFTEIGSELHNYTDSISCLHAIEHFGLGRYNDKIDKDGHLKGLKNIYNVLKKGGVFYFSTPIGPQKIEFNGQRIFSLEYLIALFKDDYRIANFSYVNDNGDLVKDAELSLENISNNFGCKYGCGIFELVKI